MHLFQPCCGVVWGQMRHFDLDHVQILKVLKETKNIGVWPDSFIYLHIFKQLIHCAYIYPVIH